MQIRLAAVLVVVAAVFAAGAHAATAGVVEICKSSTNGMAGKRFTYAVSGGSSFAVLGGRCTGPITVTGSTVTVTEGASDPATDVANVLVRPSIRKQAADLAGRSVTVTPGASTSTETLVTFVNEPADGTYGALKVCKFTYTPAYIGRQFSFSVNGGQLLPVEATDVWQGPETWLCRLLGTFPVGSVVTVDEDLPLGASITWIDTLPFDAIQDYNTTTGQSWVRVGPGATTLMYANDPLPPSGGGYLEVCKDRAYVAGAPDGGVQGSYSFAVTDAAGATQTVSVLAGQCSAPLAVAAGLTQGQELAQGGTTVSGVFTIPADRLLSVILVNRTASVEVPVSADPADETQVHFVNQAQRGQFKICKALGPSSASLAGTTYTFDWRECNPATWPLPVTAATTIPCRRCRALPTRTKVTPTETNPGSFVRPHGGGTGRV